MNLSPIHLLLGAMVVGLLGAIVGAWVLSRGVRGQLAAQLAAQLQMQFGKQMEVLREAMPLRQEPVRHVEVALPDALVHSVDASDTGADGVGTTSRTDAYAAAAVRAYVRAGGAGAGTQRRRTRRLAT